jgi:curli biogenesis system outer membrane secretion channel CsgG
MTRLANRGSRRKRVGRLAVSALIPILLAGCAPTAELVRIAPQLPPWNGPMARVAVTRFDMKAAKGHAKIGDGLATMLTSELVNSNRFMVLERDTLGDILQEQDLGAAGRVRAGTAAPVGEIEGAEILVMGAVTAFAPDAMGLGGLLVGGVTLIGSALISAKNDHVPIVAATYKESYIAMDIRMVDARTGRVLDSLTVEGKSRDWGGGILSEVGGGKSRVPLAFGGFQNTSVEAACRVAIARAVEGIVARLPGEYYRYGADTVREGQLLGYSFLEFPPGAEARVERRQAREADSQAALAALMNEWGLPVPVGADSVDFSRDTLVAVAGGPSDRGGTISLQKVVLDRDALRVDVAFFAPPPAGETKVGDDKKTAAPKAPFFLARVPKTGRPVNAVWEDGTGTIPGK